MNLHGTSANPAPSDELLRELLIAWLPNQRWFAGDASGVQEVSIDARWEIPSDGAWRAEFVLVRNPHDPPSVRYHILVGRLPVVPEHLAHAVIGAAGDSIVYDALHDPAITSALLRAWIDGRTLGTLTPANVDTDDADSELTGLVLTSEQSNTSVVYGNRIIMKFFRRLTPGVNPDAEITRALRDGGHTPRYLGEWRTTLDGQQTTVALATAYISNSADAWSLATTSVRDLLAEEDLHPDEVGGDFAAEAHRLGEVIAHLHQELVTVLPVSVEDGPALEIHPDRVLADATDLAESVPELRPLLEPLHQALTAADTTGGTDRPVDTASWAPQRIHGDLHLGQVLRSVDGWLVIDFEGEPSRPMATRRQPASPLRDIAGMLRSFGYAARQPLYESTVNTQRRYRSDEWMARNRAAFLDGYAAAYGADPRDQKELLTMYELEKAIYEVGYEYRHRPTWVEIPLTAIRTLTAKQ